VVSETPLIVSQVHPIPPEVLQDQIRLLLQSYPISAIKTGMLYSKPHIVAVCELLEDSDIPIVVDPVMVASTGDSLMMGDALDAMRKRLVPLATVITPNLPEAGVLLGKTVANRQYQESAVKELSSTFGVSTYLKGGHLENSQSYRDLFYEAGKLHSFEHDHLNLPQTHGTGCTLAAALTAAIASGAGLKEASEKAHAFTYKALLEAQSWPSPMPEARIYHLNQCQ
jgi:hydroxymethylpyrimidine/phosphomethylpyrimidine kinase